MAQTENQKRLLKILNEIFQLDRSDLDFGIYRIMNTKSKELNEFFKKMDWSVYNREFDTIYINGDNNLANLKKDEDNFKVKLIEQEFKRLMFDE